MPPTGPTAKVSGRRARLTAEPNFSRRAVREQRARTSRADEETCRDKLGCISRVTQNPVCFLCTISPRIRKPHSSKKSLEKLTRVQNAAMRLMTGGLRSTPIEALEAATGCEPLNLRRETQTLMARERFLRFGESNPLKDLAESFGATRRRLKKVSVLSAAEAAGREHDLPTDRAPLETPGWPPDLAPQPLEVCLDIGLKGKKSDFAPPPPPHFLKATAVECIDAYPKDHAKCYIDGSATEGVSDGGYGVYIEWNDNSTTSVSGPVGKRTCSFECEKAAFAECVRLLKERQSKDDQFPGAVIFCDCRSLIQNLGGFNPNNMGNILSVTEQLRQAGVRITCQWIRTRAFTGAKGRLRPARTSECMKRC